MFEWMSPLNRGEGEVGLIRVSCRPQGAAADWRITSNNFSILNFTQIRSLSQVTTFVGRTRTL